MKTKNPIKIVLATLLLLISLSASAYNWDGYFVTGSGSGCQSLGRSVFFTNTAGCYTNVNVSIILERDTGSGYTHVETKTSTVCNTTVYFSGLTQSGNYRFRITGTVNPGTCGISSLTSFTSSPITLTVYPAPSASFTVNGNASGFLPGAPLNVYTCHTMPMVYTGSTFTEYRLSIVEANYAGVPVPGGWTSNALNAWFTANPFPIDLNSGSVGARFSSYPGYYLVQLEVKNANGCYSNVQKYLLNVANSAPTPTAAFKINNQTVPTSCTTPLVVNSCTGSPITLNNLCTNTWIYRIELWKSPTACGTYTLEYDSDWWGVFFPDLRNLPGTGGTILQNTPGYYKVVLTAKDYCGVAVSAPAVGYIRVVLPITDATFQLLKPDGTSTSGSAGTTFGSPIDVGSYTAALTTIMNTSGTATDLTHYQVTVDEYTTGGAFMATRCSTPVVAVTGGILPTALLFNSSNFSPSGYFLSQCMSGLMTSSRRFKVTLQTYNQCGAGNAYSKYFYFGVPADCWRSAPAGNVDEMAGGTGNEVAVFPNPVSSGVNFEITAAEKDRITIALYDLSGAHVMDVVKETVATDGTNRFNADLGSLTAGMYLYEVKVNTTVYKGKLSKQ